MKTRGESRVRKTKSRKEDGVRKAKDGKREEERKRGRGEAGSWTGLGSELFHLTVSRDSEVLLLPQGGEEIQIQAD